MWCLLIIFLEIITYQRKTVCGLEFSIDLLKAWEPDQKGSQSGRRQLPTFALNEHFRLHQISGLFEFEFQNFLRLSCKTKELSLQRLAYFWLGWGKR